MIGCVGAVGSAQSALSTAHGALVTGDVVSADTADVGNGAITVVGTDGPMESSRVVLDGAAALVQPANDAAATDAAAITARSLDGIGVVTLTIVPGDV